MKVQKSLIVPAVAELAKIASGRTLPIMQCIKLSAANGRLHMSACDLDQSLSLEMDCEGELPELAIPAPKLSQLLSGATDDVSLSVKDDRLKIEAGFTATISGNDAKEFPLLKPERLQKVGVNCGDLANAIKSVAWCAAKDSNHRANMRCVHVLLGPKLLMCEAGDGMNLARFSQPAICAKADFCIPDDLAVRFRWALEQEGAILSVSENALRVEFDDGSYICKVSNLPYPNANPICSKPRSPLGKADAPKLADLVRSPLFLCPKTDTPAMLLIFKSDGLTVETVFGGDEFSGSAPGSFQPKESRVNAKSMAMCLSAFEAEVSISLAEHNMMIIEAGNLAVYTMPLR